jgi:hypothetical protein
MVISRHQHAGQNHTLLIGNKYFKKVAKGMTVTNQNCMRKEIKNRLISGNAYYRSVQSLSSCLLSKII